MSETARQFSTREDVLSSLQTHMEGLSDRERIVQAGLICATVLRPVSLIAERPHNDQDTLRIIASLRLNLEAMEAGLRPPGK